MVSTPIWAICWQSCSMNNCAYWVKSFKCMQVYTSSVNTGTYKSYTVCTPIKIFTNWQLHMHAALMAMMTSYTGSTLLYVQLVSMKFAKRQLSKIHISDMGPQGTFLPTQTHQPLCNNLVIIVYRIIRYN